jgi:hypothetical protein
VLSNASNYFNNLLRRNFKEGSLNCEINFRGIQSDVFELVLLFIYFPEDFFKIGVHDLKQTIWQDLLKISKYMLLDSLATICENKLSEILSKENVLSLLSFSVDFSCYNLEKACLSFISKSFHCYPFRKLLVEFLNNPTDSTQIILQKIKSFCTQMKFSIYQERAYLKSIGSFESNLDDLVFGFEVSFPGKHLLKSIFSDESRSENLLNTSNAFLISKYKSQSVL